MHSIPIKHRTKTSLIPETQRIQFIYLEHQLLINSEEILKNKKIPEINKNALSFLKHEATPDLMFKIQKKKMFLGTSAQIISYYLIFHLIFNYIFVSYINSTQDKVTCCFNINVLSL